MCQSRKRCLASDTFVLVRSIDLLNMTSAWISLVFTSVFEVMLKMTDFWVLILCTVK